MVKETLTTRSILRGAEVASDITVAVNSGAIIIRDNAGGASRRQQHLFERINQLDALSGRSCRLSRTSLPITLTSIATGLSDGRKTDVGTGWGGARSRLNRGCMPCGANVAEFCATLGKSFPMDPRFRSSIMSG